MAVRACPRDGSVTRKPLPVYVESLVAGILLVSLLPLLVLLAVAIVLDSGRPILERRRARSEFDDPIDLLTFRTTSGSGARFTRVGWFLHYTCLEQLPCLWNVLVGEMRLSNAARSCSSQ
jgi:lipopolysaccharide/colanic/teichoic acid biosynthesis glycosyltransferase